MGCGLSKNRAKGAGSTEITLYLQDACRKLGGGTQQNWPSFEPRKVEHALSKEAMPDASSPVSVDSSIHVQLQDLETTLASLEQKLRSRGEWNPPRRPSKKGLPPVSNISEISDAVKSLTAKVDASHPSVQTSARQFFEAHAWQWDASWKEFYTVIPDQGTYLYLSRWRMDASGLWYHVSMSGSNQTPEEAMDMIGKWEDWKYDPVWREWCLEVQAAEGDDAKCAIYASPWKLSDYGWEYLGRIGGAA